jgi:phosphoribosylamine--glycine ligase
VNVLVVGSGAREHALAWKLVQSPKVDALFAAPGNAGTAQLGTNWPDISATDTHALVGKARDAKIGLVVIGPEAALAAGVGDALRAAHIPAFGPNRAAARLESSKAFAKQWMARHGVPTPAYKVVHDRKQALRALDGWQGGAVIKADGLAAGKGVVVTDGADAARAIIEQWYGDHALPGGGTTLVLEERLNGHEVSVMSLVSGSTIQVLAPACDYKRALDGDAGPNTGGMGAYSPASDVIDDAMLARIEREVFARVREAMARDGMDYRGCLYAGLMVTSGGPSVLEFNARFGDPETQVVLPRLESDLCELLYATATGDGASIRPRFAADACVGVVLASAAYPERLEPVDNLPPPPAGEGVTCFWGASTLSDSRVNAGGGRVLTVTARGATIASARERAYAACASYSASLPSGRLRYRGDIAQRAAGAPA